MKWRKNEKGRMRWNVTQEKCKWIDAGEEEREFNVFWQDTVVESLCSPTAFYFLVWSFIHYFQHTSTNTIFIVSCDVGSVLKPFERRQHLTAPLMVCFEFVRYSPNYFGLWELYIFDIDLSSIGSVFRSFFPNSYVVGRKQEGYLERLLDRATFMFSDFVFL